MKSIKSVIAFIAIGCAAMSAQADSVTSSFEAVIPGYSQQQVASSEQSAKDAEAKCIQEVIQAKKDAEEGLVASYGRVIPGYAESVKMKLENPYYCSLAWVGRKG